MCQSCSAGTYGAKCDLCAKGQYRPGGNDISAEVCSTCPVGFHQNSEGSASCLSCQAGKYNNQIEQVECNPCSTGKFRVYDPTGFNATICLSCPVGFHQNSPGAASCLDCQAGKYINNMNSIECKECDKGQFRSAGDSVATTCKECNAGYAEPEKGQPVCTACRGGQYQNQRGREECIVCEIGSFLEEKDAAVALKCKNCPQGYVNTAKEQTMCIECIPGRYQNAEGADKCIGCPKGTYRSENDDKSICINCPIGQAQEEAGKVQCLECAAGKYTMEERTTTCKHCPTGQYRGDTDVNKQGQAVECKSCEMGKYISEIGQANCLSCPPKSDTTGVGKISINSCICQLDHFVVIGGEDSTKVCEKCPPKSRTLTNGMEAQGISSCVCSDAYWKPNDNFTECLICPEHAICQNGAAPMTKAGYWRVPWRAEVIDPTKSDAPNPRLRCLDKKSCLGDNSSSTSSLGGGCAPFHAPPLCAACVRGSYKQAASFQCLECDNEYNISILFMVIVVVGTLSVIIIFTLATIADGGEASAVDVVILKIAINSGIISAGASAFPLEWPPAVVTMFQIYAVASASAIGDSLSADCVLRESQMKPVQAWALTMVIIPPAVIFLWVVIFTLLSVLKKNKKYLRIYLPVSTIVTLTFAHPVVTKSAVKLLACRTIAGRDYLDADFNVLCYGAEYTTWVSGVAIPLLLLFTFGVPISYGIAMYRHVRRGNLQENRDIYGFFFSGFRKEVWWFELWNTLRKSLFTISSVLFAPAGVMMQTWGALVVLLLFLVVFSLSQPYEQHYLNVLERSALSINVITLLCGLGLFTNHEAGVDGRSPIFATVVTLCIVLLNILFVASILHAFFKYSLYCATCCPCCSCHIRKHEMTEETEDDPPSATAIVPIKKWKQTMRAAMKKQLSEHAVTVAATAAAAASGVGAVKNDTGEKMNVRGGVRTLAISMNRVRSVRTRTADAIVQNHSSHRKMMVKSIQKRQKSRRDSVQARVQARNKAKRSNALVQCTIFSDLAATSIATIIDKMEYEVVNEGTQICIQGDVAEMFYLIMAGSCNIIMNGEIIATLNELQVFGEGALITKADGKATRGATVVAVNDVQLLCLSKKKFDTLLTSGTLTSDCVKKIETVAKQREEENRLKKLTDQIVGGKEKKIGKDEKTKRVASQQYVPLSLSKASKDGDVSKVNEALNMEGVDVNEDGGDGRTPLILACWKNRIAVVQILLQRKDVRVNQARKDGYDINGKTSLHVAAHRGHVEIVRLLLQHPKIDITVQNENGDTPEVYAQNYGHTEVLQLLHQHSGINGSGGSGSESSAAAEKNVKENKKSSTPKLKINQPVVSIVVSKGGGVPKQSEALMLDVQKKEVEMIRRLIGGKIKHHTRLLKVVERLDVSHNGTLSKKECQRMVSGILKRRPTEQLMDNIWESIWERFNSTHGPGDEIDASMLGRWLKIDGEVVSNASVIKNT